MPNTYPRIIDTEFPDLIDYFESVLGKETIRSIYGLRGSTSKTTFWLGYIKQYKKWQKKGRRISEIPRDKRLMDFGMIAKAIQVFESDWNTPKQRKHFVGRLRDSKYAEGLVFELRTGIHFLRNGLDAHWVGSIGDERVPDLDIRLDGEIAAIVECTHRCPRIGRSIWDQKMAEDLLSAAKKKIQSKHDWGCSRVVVVKVPEEIDWRNGVILSSLDAVLNRWKEQNRLSRVNALIFMGKANIVPNYDKSGRATSFVTDQIAYTFPNTDATHALPAAIARTLFRNRSGS